MSKLKITIKDQEDDDIRLFKHLLKCTNKCKESNNDMQFTEKIHILFLPNIEFRNLRLQSNDKNENENENETTFNFICDNWINLDHRNGDSM